MHFERRSLTGKRFRDDGKTGDGVPVGFLGVARHRHAPAEESDVPQVGEGDAGACVDAKDLDRGERGDDAHPKADHVRHRSDGDGGRCVLVGVGQPLRHRLVHGGAPPGGQSHESVVNSNACQKRKKGLCNTGCGRCFEIQFNDMHELLLVLRRVSPQNNIAKRWR